MSQQFIVKYLLFIIFIKLVIVSQWQSKDKRKKWRTEVQSLSGGQSYLDNEERMWNSIRYLFK